MSRRESRVSINVRQNDALTEFENFKKKFLLANKHITKLNSTLSVRIEELNAQISTLYVENLRLRASEIALAAQLQREREKSWRIMTDAESASHNLSKHLGHLRKSFNISNNLPSPIQQPPMPPPRVRRPMPDPAASPQTTRLSRAPNIPGIYEDDEGEVSSSPEDGHAPSPTMRRKTKSRLSASRLPLPARVSSPPLPEPQPMGIEVEMRGARKKTSRRQSGLLTVDTRPPSPAFGSPIHREAALAQEDEDDIAITDEMSVEAELEAALRRESKKKGKAKERELDDKDEGGWRRERDKKRRREDEEAPSNTTTTTESGKKLKDVTNSPNGRAALPPLDTNTSDRERQRTPETAPTTAVSTAPSSLLPFSSEQSTPATTPAQTPHPISPPNPAASLPTPRPSSSPVPPPTSASETEGGTSAPTGGRATRTRKSVNYAEPKLNTKMRKPEPEPGTSANTRKRLSASAKPQPIPSDPTPRSSSEAIPPTKKRSLASTHTQAQIVPADDPEPRSSFETGPAPPKRDQTQPQEIKSRPTPDSPPLQIPPRPSSRPASSSFRPISSSHAYVTTIPATSSSSATTTVKRKKSRPYVDPDDFDDSDGTQADAENGGLTNGWVNVEGRRKSALHGHGGVGTTKERRLDGDDGRRHSVAV